MLGFLDPLENNYMRKNYIPERHAGKITAILIIGCWDTPAVLEGAEPRVLCEENKGEILLSAHPAQGLPARAPGSASTPLAALIYFVLLVLWAEGAADGCRKPFPTGKLSSRPAPQDPRREQRRGRAAGGTGLRTAPSAGAKPVTRSDHSRGHGAQRGRR